MCLVKRNLILLFKVSYLFDKIDHFQISTPSLVSHWSFNDREGLDLQNDDGSRQSGGEMKQGHYFLKIISDFSVNSVLPLQHEDQDSSWEKNGGWDQSWGLLSFQKKVEEVRCPARGWIIPTPTGARCSCVLGGWPSFKPNVCLSLG